MRGSANPLERPVVLAYYYIANNKIMQAPSCHQVTHARLQRCTFALQQGFARLQADLEPLTRAQQQLAKQAAREEQRRKQQQPAGQGQEQGQGQGPGVVNQPATGATRDANGGGGAVAAAGTASAPASSAGGAAKIPYTVQPYGATVDLESPSLGTLRAPLAAPLPEVMAAAAAAVAAAGGPGGGVPVRRHLTDVDRARWNKLDRILSHQFNSLQRIKYTALPQEYLQRLHQQMYGPPPPAAPPPAAAAATPTQDAAVK